MVYPIDGSGSHALSSIRYFVTLFAMSRCGREIIPMTIELEHHIGIRILTPFSGRKAEYILTDFCFHLEYSSNEKTRSFSSSAFLRLWISMKFTWNIFPIFPEKPLLIAIAEKWLAYIVRMDIPLKRWKEDNRMNIPLEWWKEAQDDDAARSSWPASCLNNFKPSTTKAGGMIMQ